MMTTTAERKINVDFVPTMGTHQGHRKGSYKNAGGKAQFREMARLLFKPTYVRMYVEDHTLTMPYQHISSQSVLMCTHK